ncbi:hypothetical protein A4X17_16445 [Plantibacter sp. H53]|uniref:hypothetical protein n=1 Tax=Plantibacter sp. H53 TaxID=1827323 RepID=UPI0007D90090|nr:hypothetical protein [Plantibacter sp. H53]OAN32796.1 hypothetical protein A4X17_16445 [Plantibacter sp. H53]
MWTIVALAVTTAASPASAAVASKPHDPPSTDSTTTYSTASGLAFDLNEALQGVVFLHGPVAEALEISKPYSDSITADEIGTVIAVESRLIESMTAADSPELDAAVHQIMSGDPYVVEEGLGVIAKSFTAALDREYPGVSATPIRSIQCGAVAVCAAVSVAAIALGAAIAVVMFNVAGNVNMVYNQNGLWDQNGVFNGKVAPRASDPTQIVQDYPSLAASEQVRRTTLGLRSW